MTSNVLAYEMPASPLELKALLSSGPYVEVDGSWKFIPAKLERDIQDTVVSIVTAKGWSFEDISLPDLLDAVQQQLGASSVPTSAVLKKALRSLAREPDADQSQSVTPSKDALQSLQLDKAKAARFQALQLLRQRPAEVRQRFNLKSVPPPQQPLAKRARLGAVSGRGGLLFEDFRSAYQELMGLAEAPSDEDIWKVIGDQACLDEFEQTLQLIDPMALPLDPVERLSRLFTIQMYWNPGRLASWMSPILGAGVKVDSWLLKHTRAVHIEITAGKEERLVTKKFAM